MYGEPLPEEIVLTRSEAKTILFALDGASESEALSPSVRHQVDIATSIIVGKFLPDLEDL